MARLRATAPAARSVLDGREHDGSLDRVGDLSIAPIKPSLKKLANVRVKKRAHAHLRSMRHDSLLDRCLLIGLVKDDADELGRCPPDVIDRPRVVGLLLGRSLGHSNHCTLGVC
jgi:hypothetical protein